MRKLITYSKSQYEPLISSLKADGFKLMSPLELRGDDQIAELLSEENLAVDVSSLPGLISSNHQLALSFEILVHQMPFGTIFIGDETTVSEENTF